MDLIQQIRAVAHPGWPTVSERCPSDELLTTAVSLCVGGSPRCGANLLPGPKVRSGGLVDGSPPASARAPGRHGDHRRGGAEKGVHRPGGNVLR